MPPSNLLGRGWPPEHPAAVRAEGCRIWTADGRCLLDGASGALVASLGYGVPEVAEAVARQLRILPYAHSLQLSHETAEAYAAELIRVLPGGALTRAFFVTGGSEAMEMALALAWRIQLARGQRQRRLFLGRHLAYHGATLATLALGGRRQLREVVAPLLAPVAHLPPPYPYRPEWHRRFPEAVAGIPGVADLLGDPSALSETAVAEARSHPAEALRVAIQALGPERVCAFVAEPIIGASAGAVVPPDDYWPRVRRVCDRYGVLWIDDEVMTGMGRTGRWLAAEHWGVVPDIVVLGKGLAAGYLPLAAVLIREDDWRRVAQGPPGFPLGFTFAHHPAAVAAGHAVLAALRRRGLVGRAERVGDTLLRRLREALRDHPHAGEVRGRGLMLAVELVADRASRAPFPAGWDATSRALAAARDAGVLLYPARGGADGIAGDAIMVAPPFTIGDPECDELVEAVVRAVEAVREAWRRSSAGPPNGRPPGG